MVNLDVLMGCQRLTYHKTFSPLRVVCKNLNVSSKSCEGQYRYLYHGMPANRNWNGGWETDGEVSGSGNSYPTEFRQYDPRLGRWKSLDPKRSVMPWETPYSFSNNTPIVGSDPKGEICLPCLTFVGSLALDIVVQMGEACLD